jgi:hypothetical protein
MISVNNIIPTAENVIAAFSANVVNTGQIELQTDVTRANTTLASLCKLHDDFHYKIERFGPEKPPKFLDGHEFSIRNRCFGDGRDPNHCGRWFVKVSVLGLFYNIVLAADIDVE